MRWFASFAFWIPGLLVLVIGIIITGRVISVALKGSQVQGVVTGFEKRTNRDRDVGNIGPSRGGQISVYPIIEFNDAEGNSRKTTGPYGSASAAKIGQKVKVNYDPKEPGNTVIMNYFWNTLFPFPLILVFLGIVSIGFGLLIFIGLGSNS